jgi:hypothetical protein
MLEPAWMNGERRVRNRVTTKRIKEQSGKPEQEELIDSLRFMLKRVEYDFRRLMTYFDEKFSGALKSLNVERILHQRCIGYGLQIM